ncbi:MAG: hypothetical protein KBE91_09925, partial [Bacteroidia bacterium]|nr:hypothetical protein [Bacteroidia bacterium]
MKKSIQHRFFIAALFSLFLFTIFVPTNASASHFVGGDVEYECIGPRTWLIKLTLYRDCNGCATCYCSNPGIGCSLIDGMVAKPSTTLNPSNCSATPNQVSVT